MSAHGTVTVELIYADILGLLRDNGADRPQTDIKILLATVMFADEEGVAHLNDGALAYWSRLPGRKRGSDQHVQRRIDVLIDAGVLAPGSTTTELRSMVGRAAEQKPKQTRGQRGRRGAKTTTATTATETTAKTEEEAE